VAGSQADVERALSRAGITLAEVVLLKSDVFGRVELAESGVVRRIACGSRVPLSRFVARRLLERERAALAHLDGLDGVPRIHERGGRGDDGTEGVLERTYVPGVPLSQAKALPENFFDELDALVEAVHARGVCHNDLHKEQNILVGEDGRPWLLDFQLASVHGSRDKTFTTRAREDLRHVEKHRRRYTRDGRGPRGERTFGRGAGQRRSLVARVWRRTGKPLYNAVVHALLRRPASEARRSSSDAFPQWIVPVARRFESASTEPGSIPADSQ
jgi:RIO-like serine/threonine protein kinase